MLMPVRLHFKGVTMSVILDLSYTVSIWISAAVAITYTLLGGLYSVAYTDIIQLVLIFISLVSCCLFLGGKDGGRRLFNPTVLQTAGIEPKLAFRLMTSSLAQFTVQK